MKFQSLALSPLLLLSLAFTGFARVRPNAAMNFRVVDDFGKPVEGATVTISTFHHWQRGEGFGKDITETFRGTTDEKGMVSIVGQSLRGDFAYGVTPLPGFYRGGGGEFKFTSVVNGRWEPWRWGNRRR